MKSITIISYNNIIYDSRVKKHIDFFYKHNFNITIITVNKDIKQLKKIYPLIHIKTLPFYSSQKTLYFFYHNILIKFYCYNLLKQINTDIYWANDFEALLPLYLRKKHKIIIYDSHEIWAERIYIKKSLLHLLISKIEYILEKNIVNKIDKFITISQEIRNYLKKSLNYKKHIYIIRNIPQTYNIDLSINRKMFNIPEHIILFVYVGGLVKHRNINKLIQAFIELNNKNIGLLLIGNNQLSLNLKQYEKYNIFHINTILEEQINNYLKIADIGIHPLNTKICLNHKYALPNKIFQYIQSGLALCVYENNSTINIIKTYKNGIYAEMNTKENIKNAIETILNNDIKIMKNNSLTAYKEEYNWNKELKIYKHIIRNL